MFVPPPPPQLTVAEIAERLAAQQAAGINPPTSPPSSTKADSFKSLSRSRSKSSPFTLKRAGRINAKSTQKNAARTAGGINPPPPRHIVPPPPPPPPPPPAIPLPERLGDNFMGLILPAFEEPRRAPQPPKRPPRPPSELFLPSPPGIPKPSNAASRRPERTEILPSLPPPLPPPPIPDKSPLRRAPAIKQPEPLMRPRPLSTEMSPPSTASASSSSMVASSRQQQHVSPASSATPSKKPPPTHSNETAQVAFNTALAHMKSRARRDSASSSISGTSQSTTASSFVDRVGRMARSATAPPGTLTRVQRNSSLAAFRSGLLMGSGGSSRSLPTRSKHARKISIASSRSLDAHLARGAAERARKGGAASSSRVAAACDVRAALLQLDGSRGGRKRVNAVLKPIRSPQPLENQTRGKRRKKGETMSMLLETGFFPIEEIIYGTEKKGRRPTSKDYRINLPPRLSFPNGSLPSTPGSNPLTPAELNPNSPSPTTPITPKSIGWNRKSGAAKRSVLSQIPEYDCKANSGRIKDESESISPSRLEAIPEDNTTDEHSRPASIIETPVATQIHLRGGSVVTVTPPELTAWQPAVYLHGPIKLPKPAIMPRKNSVASLEAFQEAIDQVYQHALHIPRRRSDDAVVDDICDFFDEFGFDWVSFEGDRLGVDYMDVDEIEEAADDEAEQPERFSTPPAEPPAASPVEVTVAREVLETITTTKLPLMTGSKTSVGSIPRVVVPPVENEETLRAKGIARLSRSSRGSASSNPLDAMAEQRKGSLTIGSRRGSGHEEAGGLQLLPAPEESMLDAVLQAGRSAVRSSSSRKGVESASVSGSVSGSLYRSSVGQTGGRDNASAHSSQRSAGEQGFDWDDDVEEIDAGSTWLASVAAPKKPVTMKTRKSGSRMRRLVATASTIL